MQPEKSHMRLGDRDTRRVHNSVPGGGTGMSDRTVRVAGRTAKRGSFLNPLSIVLG